MRIAVVTSEYAYLYEKPDYLENSMDVSGISDQVLHGWLLEIESEQENTFYVETHYGYDGYIEKMKVDILTEWNTEALKARNSMFVVTAPSADVWTIPKVQGRSLMHLYRGSLVTCLKESQENSGCAYVQLADGTRGYLPGVHIQRRKDNDGYFASNEKTNYFSMQQNISLLDEDDFRTELVKWAYRYLGSQYRWGGKTPDGIDCSGLTSMCYMLSGIHIYRDARIQENYPVREIALERAEAGDLLYFPGHIAMYLGNSRYIHSTGNINNYCCTINSLNPVDEDYRKDLHDKLYAVGSIF